VPNDQSRSVQQLLGEVPSPQDISQAFTFPHLFNVKMAEVRFVLCAMWDLSPRSPRTGEPYDRSMLSEVLAGQSTATNALELCFPRTPVARGTTANRVFLLGDEESIGERPASTKQEAWNDILTSHALDAILAHLLLNGDHEQFLEERGRRLDGLTRAFLERMTEFAFEDTPPLDDLDADEDEGSDVEPQ
jgi:hypothetical protein